jgi:hypothetical protein
MADDALRYALFIVVALYPCSTFAQTNTDACNGSEACSIYSTWLALALNQLASSQATERGLRKELAQIKEQDAKTAEFWRQMWNALTGEVKAGMGDVK